MIEPASGYIWVMETQCRISEKVQARVGATFRLFCWMDINLEFNESKEFFYSMTQTLTNEPRRLRHERAGRQDT